MYIDERDIFPTEPFYVIVSQFFNARDIKKARKTNNLIEWETTVVLIAVT